MSKCKYYLFIQYFQKYPLDLITYLIFIAFRRIVLLNEVMELFADSDEVNSNSRVVLYNSPEKADRVTVTWLLLIASASRPDKIIISVDSIVIYANCALSGKRPSILCNSNYVTLVYITKLALRE